MLNPVKVDRFMTLERRLGKRQRINWLRFIATKSSIRYNRIQWKTEADATAELYKQYKDPYWYIISPFSLFRHLWDGLLTICYMLFLFQLPFRLAIVRTKHTPILNLVQLLVDFIFLTDIGINFFTAIYIPEKRTIIYTPSIIAKKYLKGFFAVDLFSSLPYDGAVAFLKYNVKLELPLNVYFLFFFYYIKLFRFTTFLSNIKKFLFMIRLGDVIIEVIGIVIVWFSVSYLLISALYFFNANSDRNNLLVLGDPLTCLTFLHNTTNFIFTVSLRTNSETTGNIVQVMGQLSILFVSTLIEPFIGAIVIVFYWSTRNSDIKYRAMIDEVNSYTQALRAPSEINKKTIEYFKMYYHRSMLLDDKKAMDFFSGHDQMIILSNMVTNIAMKVELFRDLPPTILLEMVKRLKREILFTGYKLTIAGQIGSKLHIVSSGKIILFTINYTKMSEVGEGSSLGEYQLLSDSPYPLTTICAEITTVYTLSRDDFNDVVLHLTEIYSVIREKIIERHMNLLVLLDRLKTSGNQP